MDAEFDFWCQRFAPEVWYGKERDQAKEREYHRLRTCFKGGWDAGVQAVHTAARACQL